MAKRTEARWQGRSYGGGGVEGRRWGRALA